MPVTGPASEMVAPTRHGVRRGGRLEDVDPASYPAAARIGRTFFTLPMPEIFDSGLDWILAGLATELTARPAT